MMAAEAPSVKYEELAAVTVPFGLIKAGLSLAIRSIVLTLMPLSFEIVDLPGTEYEMTSVKRPFSWALRAFVWDRTAKMSGNQKSISHF